MKHLFKKGHKHSEKTKQKLSKAKIGEKNPMWKGGRHNDGHGYIRINLGGKKYIMEHRYIMEKHLGRKLEKWEHVHHIDGNKKNNNLKNLIVMKKSQHHKLHLRKHIGCIVENCDRPHRAKGMCAYHYNKELNLSRSTATN